MDWESLYGSCARYEERLREVERENYARRVWASNHPRRSWRSVVWLQWLKGLITRRGPSSVRYDAHFATLPMRMPEQES